MVAVSEITCPVCNGRGNIPFVRRDRTRKGYFVTRAKVCEACDGTGAISLTPDAVAASIKRLVDDCAFYKR